MLLATGRADAGGDGSRPRSLLTMHAAVAAAIRQMSRKKRLTLFLNELTSERVIVSVVHPRVSRQCFGFDISSSLVRSASADALRLIARIADTISASGPNVSRTGMHTHGARGTSSSERFQAPRRKQLRTQTSGERLVAEHASAARWRASAPARRAVRAAARAEPSRGRVVRSDSAPGRSRSPTPTTPSGTATITASTTRSGMPGPPTPSFRPASISTNRTLHACARRAADYIVDASVSVPVGGAAFLYKGRCKLGGLALAIVALLEGRRALATETWDDAISRAGRLSARHGDSRKSPGATSSRSMPRPVRSS